MRTQPLRIRIAEDGSIEIVDPGPDELALLRDIDPGFVAPRVQLPGFSGIPRVVSSRLRSIGRSVTELPGIDASLLWRLHDAALRSGIAIDGNGASLLDAKIELADRQLSNCSLCARRCGVDRVQGGRGVCGLGTTASVADAYLHVAEEAEIAPAFTVAFAGCGLRCRFCQQHGLLDPAGCEAAPCGPAVWDRPDLRQARSLCFNGGNPDESLPSVLRLLRSLPDDFRLPIVWKTHSYLLLESVRLLENAVDCWLPDLKWGSERCGRKLSRVPDYPRIACAAIEQMARQGVPVIVRMLVIPGHVECCHRPSLEALAGISARASGPVIVSIRDQYAPDYQIGPRDAELSRRPSRQEIGEIDRTARRLGLQRSGVRMDRGPHR